MLVILLIAGLLLFAAPASAAESPGAAGWQESAAFDAAKSFAAWNIKYGSKYDSFDSAWQGWLDDPQVPDRLKIAGAAAKEKIRENIENIQQKTLDLKRQAEEAAQDLADQARQKFESAKESAVNAVDNWLNQAITGGESGK